MFEFFLIDLHKKFEYFLGGREMKLCKINISKLIYDIAIIQMITSYPFTGKTSLIELQR